MLLETSPRVYGGASGPTEYGAVSFPSYGVHVVTLAHQGGWDEMLMVLGPLVLVGGALWLANRRVTRQLAEQEAATDPDTP